MEARRISSLRPIVPSTRPSARARTEPSRGASEQPTCPVAGSLCAMGLLDEAIREHLDLKRRRGADPTEVERAEREALGPVRRDPFEHADDEPQSEVGVAEPEGAYDQAEEEYAPAEAASPQEEGPFADEEPFGEE